MPILELDLNPLDFARVCVPVFALPLVNGLLVHFGLVGLFNDADDHLEEEYFQFGGEHIRADGVYMNDGAHVLQQGFELRYAVFCGCHNILYYRFGVFCLRHGQRQRSCLVFINAGASFAHS